MNAIGRAGAGGALSRDAVHVWAASRGVAAMAVPASGAEAAAWAVRGWAEVALGCAVLGRAFDGLDGVVRSAGIRHGGPGAVRLRALRALGGTVPAYYPDAGDPGPVAPVGVEVWRLCGLLAEFCDAVPMGVPAGSSRGRDSARGQLRWGERYRPEPARRYRIVRGDAYAGMVWRTWMRLPCPGGSENVLVAVGRKEPELQRRVWLGIHEGAHLDQLAVGEGELEFGAGLLAAESYAMAVEIVALLEAARDGQVELARWLRHGLLERVGRMPGFDGQVPAARGFRSPELGWLPTLASTYVTGPFALLCAPGTTPLHARWRAALAGAPRAAEVVARISGTVPAPPLPRPPVPAR
ncbi:hypothetical protein Aph01nite_64380 [Acrocarpospora phusangensis]|uniref:Uncharacterized protein n=1 Tax=Acrocarpospora phusangensis TaxID=1070424 RepID=A0A919US16_9ACTN|nr:hypothetical protein [Acrocarpospora phusangensis]GIH28128.1 hypothetical protein Aph01nite_64380 [Acrocarpospora phusangensis]